MRRKRLCVDSFLKQQRKNCYAIEMDIFVNMKVKNYYVEIYNQKNNRSIYTHTHTRSLKNTRTIKGVSYNVYYAVL